jgi:hypothetical protein
MPDAHYPTIILEPRNFVYVGPGFPFRRRVDNAMNHAGFGDRVTGAFLEYWYVTYSWNPAETPEFFINGSFVGKMPPNYVPHFGPYIPFVHVLPVETAKVYFNYQPPPIGRLLFEIRPSGREPKYGALVGPILFHLNWEEPGGWWPLAGAWVPPTVSII